MRIEPEDGDLRSHDTEVPPEGFGHEAQLVDNLVLGDKRRDILERNVTGNNADLERLRNHEHQHVLCIELLLEILGVPRVAEALGIHGLLVDWSGHQHIDVTFFDVGDCPFKGSDGGPGRLRCGLSRLHIDIVRETVEDVDSLGFGLRCILDDIGVHLVEIVDQLAVEAEDLR